MSNQPENDYQNDDAASIENDDNDNGKNDDRNPGELFIIKLRGLPWTVTSKEIIDFLDGVHVTDGEKGVHMITYSRNSTRPNGEAFVVCATEADYNKAFTFNKKNMGHRYIEIFSARQEDFENIMRKQNTVQLDTVVKLRGLPWKVTEKEIEAFFKGLELNKETGVHIHLDSMGRASGEAFVQFESTEDCEKALKQNLEKIGHRYIEIFRSTASELRRSMMSRQFNDGGGRPSPYDRNVRGDRGGMSRMGGGDMGRNNMRGGNGRGRDRFDDEDWDNMGNWNNNNFNNRSGNFGNGNSLPSLVGNGFGNGFGNNFGNNNFGNGNGNNGCGNGFGGGNNGGNGFGGGNGGGNGFGGGMLGFGNNNNSNGNNFGNFVGNNGGGNGFGGGNNGGNNNGGNNGYGALNTLGFRGINDLGNNSVDNFQSNNFGGGNNMNNSIPQLTGISGLMGGGGSGNNSLSGRNNNSGNNSNSGFNDSYCVHLRGMPYYCEEMDIMKFFAPLKPINCKVIYNDKGMHSGSGRAYFESNEDAVQALKLDKEKMGSRYIELFYDTPGSRGGGGGGGGFGNGMGRGYSGDRRFAGKI